MSTNPMLPAIGQRWPGVDGQYIGATTDPSGELYALVVLDARPDHDLTWSEAREWAASVGGALPTRPEGALAFANAPQVFKPRWHWLDEQLSAHDAWCQGFVDGNQTSAGKFTVLRARAFRRFKLSPSALATQQQDQPTAAQGPSLEQVQQALLAAGLSARFSYRLAFSVGYDYALSAQPQAAQAVPQGWLFRWVKPGKAETFCSIESKGTEVWPLDQWQLVTRQPLAPCGEPERVWPTTQAAGEQSEAAPGYLYDLSDKGFADINRQQTEGGKA